VRRPAQDSGGVAGHVSHNVSGRPNFVNDSYSLAHERCGRIEIVCSNAL